MTFEYCQRVTVDAEIDIPDIGECAILARTDLGEEYYFLTRSELGYVDIIEYGPAIPELSVLPANVVYTYDHFEWSTYKIEKRIDKFLNNTKRGITQAQVVEPWEVLQHIQSPAHRLFDASIPDDIEEDVLIEDEDAVNDEE